MPEAAEPRTATPPAGERPLHSISAAAGRLFALDFGGRLWEYAVAYDKDGDPHGRVWIPLPGPPE